MTREASLDCLRRSIGGCSDPGLVGILAGEAGEERIRVEVPGDPEVHPSKSIVETEHGYSEMRIYL